MPSLKGYPCRHEDQVEPSSLEFRGADLEQANYRRDIADCACQRQDPVQRSLDEKLGRDRLRPSLSHDEIDSTGSKAMDRSGLSSAHQLRALGSGDR